MPIAREQNSIIKRCISENGARAITHYEVINRNSEIFKNVQNTQIYTKSVQNFDIINHNLGISEDLEIVKCLLETGRTHQIRVHFAAIGHPLLGDTLYGSASSLIARQALHAYQITFFHPITKKRVCYVAPIPNDFNAFFQKRSCSKIS